MNSGCKPIALRLVKSGAYFFCSTILLATIFSLQFSLLIGPFLDVLILLALTVLSLLFSLVFIPLNGFGKPTSYYPFLLILVGFIYTFLGPDLAVGHRLHFWMNKDNLESIDQLSLEENINEMTDMLRFQKRLNQNFLSNQEEYSTSNEIDKAFGEYIRETHLDLSKVVELRNKLEASDVISLLRIEGYLILTVDGFVDNEYGYIKSSGIKLEIGENLPPFGFTLVRLISLDNGWYFFYTT